MSFYVTLLAVVVGVIVSILIGESLEMADAWVERWTVKGTSGKDYTVALKKDKTWGCSCPAWIFQKQRPRVDCQHILQTQMQLLKRNDTSVKDLFPSPSPKQQETKTPKPTRSIRLED